VKGLVCIELHRVSPRVQSYIVSLFDYVIKTVSLSLSRQSDARTGLRRNGCSSGSHTKKCQMPQGLKEEHDPLPGGAHFYTHPRPGSRNGAHQSCGKTGDTRTISPPQTNAKECKRARKNPTLTQPGTTSLIEAVGPRPLPTNLTTNSKTDLQSLQPTVDSRQRKPDCQEMGKRRPNPLPHCPGPHR